MATPWPTDKLASVASTTFANVSDPAERLYQVIPVTTTPLVALATATEIGDNFVSPSTLAHAGTALWQIERLNAAIDQQTLFNAVHGPARYRALKLGRSVEAIALAAAEINVDLHGRLGDAATTWYAELRDAVAHDLWKVERNQRLWTRVMCLRPWMVVGDLGAISRRNGSHARDLLSLTGVDR